MTTMNWVDDVIAVIEHLLPVIVPIVTSLA